MNNLTGGIATKDNFFDRVTELARFWEDLKADNLLLLAPRRVGKTSLMLRMQETARDHKFSAAYMSAEGVRDELGFVHSLVEVVRKLSGTESVFARLSRSGVVGDVLKRIETVGPIGLKPAEKETWSKLGEELVGELSRVDGQWLFLIDELPLFVLDLIREDPTAKRARDFLSWFRAVRQKPEHLQKIRWVLAGSIGLDAVATRYRFVETINDLTIERLGAFTPEVAREFLKALGAGYQIPLSAAVLDRTLERVGWLIPFYLQLLFKGLRDQPSKRGQGPTLADLDKAFEDLLAPAHKSRFDYWQQRLVDELGKIHGDLALALLSTIAHDPKGATLDTLAGVLMSKQPASEDRADLLRYLLDILINDGYVITSGERIVFQSPLLRAFWMRRVVGG